jgi:tripartite-type tricarboxylate transporter receptor subunit TctC
MKPTQTRTALAAACLAAAWSFITAPASGQAPEQFYAGKQVNIIVGFEVGGGYDAYARMLARHWGKHLNGASVVVQNMPGAGSLKAANYVFSVAPKDGTVFGTIGSGVAFEPLYDNPAATFKATEFSWIGSINAEVSSCQAWHTAPVKRFEDALTREFTVGGTGTGADSNLFPKVLNALVGTKLKLVSGYPGAAPIFLAIERGELEGICGIYWSSVMSLHGDWIRDGKLIPLVQLAVEKHPEHPDVPLVLDYAKTPADRQALELIFAPLKFARPFFGPPGVPADRVGYLRAGFDATMKDPAFRADAEKAKFEIGPATGQEIEALIKRLYASPKDVVERAKVGRN